MKWFDDWRESLETHGRHWKFHMKRGFFTVDLRWVWWR